MRHILEPVQHRDTTTHRTCKTAAYHRLCELTDMH